MIWEVAAVETRSRSDDSERHEVPKTRSLRNDGFADRGYSEGVCSETRQIALAVTGSADPDDSHDSWILRLAQTSSLLRLGVARRA